MLEMVVTKSSITADCGLFTVVNSTGPYDLDTNPGGFGAPNEERANLYILLLVMLKKSTGDETIAVPSYNPNTADSWGIPIQEDGWYEVTMFACLSFTASLDDGAVFDTGMITYHASKFWIALQDDAQNVNPGDDADFWVEVTLPEQLTNAIDLEQADVYLAQDNFNELCNSRICAARRLAKSEPCGCGECDDCKNITLYEKMRMKIEAVEIQEAAGAYSKGQLITETLQVLCTNSDC